MNGQCEGWAYARCAAAADLVLSEHWSSGRWTAQEICVEHLKQALDWWPAENDPADRWCLKPLTRQV